MNPVDLRATGQIGDGAGEFENAGVAAGGKTQFVGDLFEQGVALGVEFAEFADVASLHLTVGVQAKRDQARTLQVSGAIDPLADGAARFTRLDISEILVGDAGNLNMQVDTVKQRAGEFAAVAL